MSTAPPEAEPEAREDAPFLDELHDEISIGGTARGQAANAVLLALSRAARSFLIYEPTNEAIRIFLENLRNTSSAFIDLYGELELEIRPFELVHHSEVVYLDRDRERSLAFRLYRDGVRKLTMRPGMEWQELLKLLEVMSIRFTGIRQAEDDLVVLLWKAAFTHIAFEAVEGFIADSDDEGGLVQHSMEGRVVRIEAPPDFDLPLPVRTRIAAVQYRVIPQAALDELCLEDDSQTVAGLALRLCEDLFVALADPNEVLVFTDLLSHLNETREFVYSEGHMAVTLRLAYAAAASTTRDANNEAACLEFLQGFVSAHGMRRFLHSVSQDAVDAPLEFYAMLNAIPGDHLKTLLDVLTTETGEASRRVACRIVEMYVNTRGNELVDYTLRANDILSRELLEMLLQVDPLRGLEACRGLMSRPETSVQLAVIKGLESLPDATESNRLLIELANNGQEELRPRAMTVLAARRTAEAFQPLLIRLKREATSRLSLSEAEAIGATLMAIDSKQALAAFRGWCRPRGLLAGVLSGNPRLQRAAVSGLTSLAGDEAESLIRAVHEGAGSELQTFCTAAMVRRRRILRGGRP